MAISMPEWSDGCESIGHWQLMTQNGVSHLKVQCLKCKIWVDGPVFLEKNGIHLLETFPCDTHRIIEIAAKWKQILQEEAGEHFKNLCIHIQIAHLDLTHDYMNYNESKGYAGFIHYFHSGRCLREPRAVVEGYYDAVLITLAPTTEDECDELERVICHELVHAAYPGAGGTRSVKPGTSMHEFCSDSIAEHWFDMKTTQLLEKHGYSCNRQKT